MLVAGRPRDGGATGFQPGRIVDFWDLTNRQDWHVNELTQLGLRSRAYRPGPYSNAEGLLAAFDRHYVDCMKRSGQLRRTEGRGA